ncbi:MAG: glycosyl transferase family 1, partial [Nitrososphaerota archaeon]|nr:glycosyl transferase family 1 [Nitrososphaerota archaeon]
MLNVIFVAYDRNSSGIASYTLELARLASEIFNVSIISFDALDGIDGIHVIDVPRPPFPAYLPLLNARVANGRITDIIKGADPDIVHETLPPLAWNVENLVTTQWGYVNYFKLAMIRTLLMQFPY